jgi:hypothetical protein
MKKKISSIIKDSEILNTESYNKLTPVMKEAIKDVFKTIEKETSDILTRFDSAVEKIAKFHNVNKKDLFEYFEKETNEQLGIK